jgi:hypothetical protein
MQELRRQRASEVEQSIIATALLDRTAEVCGDQQRSRPHHHPRQRVHDRLNRLDSSSNPAHRTGQAHLEATGKVNRLLDTAGFLYNCNHGVNRSQQAR